MITKGFPQWLTRGSELGRRLAAATVAFSTLVALIATAIQLGLDYRRDVHQIEATFLQISQSYLPTIANALWATNRPELQVAVDGLAHLPDVRYVEVKEGEKSWAQSGQVTSRDIISRQFTLTHQHRGQTIDIGHVTVVADLTGVYQRLWEKFWIILSTNTVKTFLVAGFMLWLFHRLVTRHLQRVAEFASHRNTTNLDERLVLDRPKHASNGADEFDRMTEALSLMQSSLAGSLAETKRLNAELEQRVLERTAKLERINQELESFSYSVSHDLRAPLRSIDGFSQMLIEDYADKLDATGNDYLHRVRHAAQRMGAVIDDLLRLARITRTGMHRAHVDLSSLAAEVVTELRQRINAPAATLTIQPGMIANGDPALLRLALENLLNNAFKYSSKLAEPTIEFAKTTHNGRTVFFVRDNGAGFDMAYVDKLFGTFQRLHHEDEFPGTGIGLAIAKRVISRHSGEIWAEGAPGKGATFYFTLGDTANAQINSAA